MSPRPFAHLMPAEAVLWARWLTQHPGEYDRFAYDVRVGRGRPVPAGTPGNVARDWEILTKQRIDVVGFRGQEPTLFEVAPRGGRGAFGAIELYAELYRETFAYQGPLPLVLVVGSLHPDFRRIAAQRQITVYILPPEEGG